MRVLVLEYFRVKFHMAGIYLKVAWFFSPLTKLLVILNESGVNEAGRKKKKKSNEKLVVIGEEGRWRKNTFGMARTPCIVSDEAGLIWGALAECGSEQAAIKGQRREWTASEELS